MAIIITKGSKQSNSWQLHFLRSVLYRKWSIYRNVRAPLSDVTLPFLLKIIKLFVLFKWNSSIVNSSSIGMEGFVLMSFTNGQKIENIFFLMEDSCNSDSKQSI